MSYTPDLTKYTNVAINGTFNTDYCNYPNQQGDVNSYCGNNGEFVYGGDQNASCTFNGYVGGKKKMCKRASYSGSADVCKYLDGPDYYDDHGIIRTCAPEYRKTSPQLPASQAGFPIKHPVSTVVPSGKYAIVPATTTTTVEGFTSTTHSLWFWLIVIIVIVIIIYLIYAYYKDKNTTTIVTQTQSGGCVGNWSQGSTFDNYFRYFQ